MKNWWIFSGRTNAKAEAPLWPPDVKSQHIGKDPDVVKYWGQEEKGATEDEMIGWHHWHSGQEFKQNSEHSEGQGSWHAAVHWVAKNRTWLSDWTIKTTSLILQGNIHIFGYRIYYHSYYLYLHIHLLH